MTKPAEDDVIRLVPQHNNLGSLTHAKSGRGLSVEAKSA